MTTLTRYLVFKGTLTEWLSVAHRLIERGQLYDLAVLHDGWCRLLRTGGPCDCAPDVRVVRYSAAKEHA